MRWADTGKVVRWSEIRREFPEMYKLCVAARSEGFVLGLVAMALFVVIGMFVG